MIITQKAPAKINLYLDVMSKRQDGYHNIRSIMQSVTLYDTVTVEKYDGIVLTSTNSALPTDEKNLAVKAAMRFFEKVDGGARIHIDKAIPVSSGLAGGSTDAAATLSALNELYGNPLGSDELLNICTKLGADVPFCMIRGCAICEGIGEKLTKISSDSDYFIVIARSGDGISTPEAYMSLDEKFGDSLSEDFGNIDAVIKAIKSGDTNSLAKNSYNIFEEVTDREDIETIKKILIENGALTAMMSGSGPAVFGIFQTSDQADRAADKLKTNKILSFVCKPE